MAGNRAIIAISEGVNPDGKMTERSVAIVEKAVELLKRGEGDYIVFMEGNGFRFVGKIPIMEGTALRDYAISLGAQPDRLLLTEPHVDTLGDALFTKPVVDRMGSGELLLVAGEWHMLRTSYLFHMVFGQKYKMTQIRARDTFTQEQLDRILPAEMLSLALTMSMFKEYGIKPGESQKIMEMMKARYGYYNPGAKDSELQATMLRELNRHRNKQPILDKQKY